VDIYNGKPYFWGGWENKEIIVISELLDKAINHILHALKFSK
jgi:hypothetical protein